MRKLTLLIGALLIAGASFACDGDKKTAKACCKKDEKKECCKKGTASKDCSKDHAAKESTTKEVVAKPVEKKG
jgi:hypothetical protein